MVVVVVCISSASVFPGLVGSGSQLELAVDVANISIMKMDNLQEFFVPQEIVLDFQRTFVTLILGADASFQQVSLFLASTHYIDRESSIK